MYQPFCQVMPSVSKSSSRLKSIQVINRFSIKSSAEDVNHRQVGKRDQLSTTWSIRVRRSFSLMLLGVAFFSGSYALWLPAKAALAQNLIEHAWQKSQTQGHYLKPWAWMDATPVLRLEANHQHFIVLSGVSGQALAFGPGHVSQSGMPGQQRSVVIAAHQDTQFEFLKRLQKGDKIVLENLKNQRFTYRVSHMRLVNSQKENIQIAAKQQLQLITCYPNQNLQEQMQGWRGRTPLRLVVYADRVAG